MPAFSRSEMIKKSRETKKRRCHSIIKQKQDPSHPVTSDLELAHPEFFNEYAQAGKFTQVDKWVKEEFDTLLAQNQTRREKLGPRL